MSRGRPPHRVAQIMQGAGEDPVPGAGLTAEGTGPTLVIPTARDELRAWQHLGVGNAQSGVRRVDSRTTHDNALPSQRLFSWILRLRPGFIIPKLPVVMLKSHFVPPFTTSGVPSRRDGSLRKPFNRWQIGTE